MQENTQNRQTILRLWMVVFGMFVFGFALVPLYDVFCDITGANGKTAGKFVAIEEMVADEDRIVTIQFLTNNNADMPWIFRSGVRSMKVHPGELNETEFFVRNPVSRTMTAQAVPSVTPFYAAEYLHKTECFCFEQQQLAGGEDLQMPLRFIIDPDLPAEVTTLTLSYTLFDITEQVSQELAVN
ncbi:MAG: cytochrome c oxidase assembly protein [Proteobacteria bacterium]|nr:cytochrome c oxidase assembly protein [Pseudomonadota bacterium]